MRMRWTKVEINDIITASVETDWILLCILFLIFFSLSVCVWSKGIGKIRYIIFISVTKQKLTSRVTGPRWQIFTQYTLQIDKIEYVINASWHMKVDKMSRTRSNCDPVVSYDYIIDFFLVFCESNVASILGHYLQSNE